MFLNGILFGASAFLPRNTGFPTKSAYTSAYIYGNGQFDDVHILSRELSVAEIRALRIDEQPIWDGNTLMLATFDGNINAGNVSTALSIDNWQIYRRKQSETSFDLLDTLSSSMTQYVDYTAQPNQTYIYQLLGTNATEITNPLISQPIISDYFNWVLLNPTTGVSYIFDLNLDDSGLTNEYAHQRYDGYNKYSQHSFGKRDFMTGGISAIVNSQVTVDGIDQTTDFLKGLREFINDGQTKILKSRKGDIYQVVTYGYRTAPLQNSIKSQPYSVSFQFEEVGEL